MQGVLIYLAIYVFTNLGVFACIQAMQRDGQMVETIADLAGLARTHPGSRWSLRFVPQPRGHCRRWPASSPSSMSSSPPSRRGLYVPAVIGVLASVIGAVLLSAHGEGDVFRRAGAGLRRRCRARASAPIIGDRRRCDAVLHRRGIARRSPSPKRPPRRCCLDGLLAAGYALKAFDVIDSTNEEARRLALAGEEGPSGSSPSARARAGAGAGGLGSRHRAISPPPCCCGRDKPPSEAAQLSFVAALAASDMVAFTSRRSARIAVKWPNDVLADGRKIAGILLESASGGSGRLDWLAVGIGVNLARHPEGTEFPATSLAALGETVPPPRDALARLAAGLAKWYDVWMPRGFRRHSRRMAGAGAQASARASGRGLQNERNVRRVRRHRRNGRASPARTQDRVRAIAAGEVSSLVAMLLAIDAGNTNIVFAVYDGENLRAQWRAVTNIARTADEYAVLAEPASCAGRHDFCRPRQRASSPPSCRPALFDLRRCAGSYLKCEPLVVGDPNRGSRHQGAMSIVPMPWARTGSSMRSRRMPRYKGALIVVDFGTATTFDIVAANGDYEGSVIAPGANLSAEALHQAAAMLPRVAIQRTQTVIGKDTVPAMQSGLYWGYIGLIEGLSTRIKAEYGKPMTVIGTGGLANLFYRQTPAIDHIDPDLTIRGLVLIHARNAARAKA